MSFAQFFANNVAQTLLSVLLDFLLCDLCALCDLCVNS